MTRIEGIKKEIEAGGGLQWKHLRVKARKDLPWLVKMVEKLSYDLNELIGFINELEADFPELKQTNGQEVDWEYIRDTRWEEYERARALLAELEKEE